MYALVRFSDETFYVCKSSKVIRKMNNLVSVRYANSKSYEGRVITFHQDADCLTQIKRNLEAHLPKIHLERWKQETDSRQYEKEVYTNQTCNNSKYASEQWPTINDLACTNMNIPNQSAVELPMIENQSDCIVTNVSSASGSRSQLPSTVNQSDNGDANIQETGRSTLNLPSTITRTMYFDKTIATEITQDTVHDNIQDVNITFCSISTMADLDENENIDKSIRNTSSECNPHSLELLCESGSIQKKSTINILQTVLNLEDDCNLSSVRDDNMNCNTNIQQVKTCEDTQRIFDISTFFNSTPNTDADLLEQVVENTLNKDDSQSLMLCDVDSDNVERLNTCKNIEQENDDVSTNGSEDAENFNVYDENRNKCNKTVRANDIDDPDYLPSDHFSDLSDRVDDENDQDKENTSPDKSVNTPNASIIFNASSIPMPQVFCNDAELYVPSSSTCKKDKKKNCCLYCGKLQTKIARHLETIHKNEPDVKKFTMLPKNNRDRKKIIDIIRRNGNFKFNTDAQLNNGELIVCRRPQEIKNRTVNDYVPCIHCKGYFAKSTLRHHFQRCTKKNSKYSKSTLVLGRSIILRSHEVTSKIMRTMILPVMRDDDISRIIRYDRLIILYGNKMCVKYKLQHQHDMIRAHLRLLGRFLIAIKTVNTKIIDFESIYNPHYYDNVIVAVNAVSGLNEQTGCYNAPTTAANLGTFIKRIGQLLITECIKSQDKEKKEEVEDFLKLIVEDYGISVNKTVIETRLQQQRQKDDQLPLMEDIRKLYMYLKKLRTEAFNELNKKFKYTTWLTLSESTLTSVQLFNRRRAGEIERVLIEDFKNYKSINEDNARDLFESLSKPAQDVAKKYVRFVIRGKLGRTVSVMLHADLLNCINLILQFRKEAKVPAQNPYVFGLPGFDAKRFKYLRACILLRKFASESDAKIAYLLRGTKLRRHIATYCSAMELSDVQVSDLANFMGHAENIHRQVYRQPVISREIGIITRYLEAAGGMDPESEEDDYDDMIEELPNETNNSPNESNVTLHNISNILTDETACESQDVDDPAEVDPIDISTKKRKQPSRRSRSPFGPTRRVRWTREEKDIVLSAFGKYLEGPKLPPLKDIHQLIQKSPCLKKRSSPQIKTWLHNHKRELQRSKLKI